MNKAFLVLVVATALVIGYVAGAIMTDADKIDRAIMRVHNEMTEEIIAGRPFKLAGSDIKILPIKNRPKSVRARIDKSLLIAGAGAEGYSRTWEGK